VPTRLSKGVVALVIAPYSLRIFGLIAWIQH